MCWVREDTNIRFADGSRVRHNRGFRREEIDEGAERGKKTERNRLLIGGDGSVAA